MTQEEKNQLLSVILCGLKYGIICAYKPYEPYHDLPFSGEHKIQTIYIRNDGKIVFSFNNSYDSVEVENIKPYVRPLSSMTEEEKEELKVLTDNKFSLRFDGRTIINLPILELDGGWHCGSLTSSVDSFDIISLIDWLNSHHFDYRTIKDEDGKEKTMIELGLALEAPEGMYNFLTINI